MSTAGVGQRAGVDFEEVDRAGQGEGYQGLDDVYVSAKSFATSDLSFL